MNMTRAILEGIHEVELQVTPEFQKEPRDAGVDGVDLHLAFTTSGWSLASTQHSAQMETTTNSYEHSKIPGAMMRFTYRTDTSKVVGQMLVRSGPNSEPLWFDPEPNMVEKLTKDWLAIEAKEKVPEIVTVIEMLSQLAWTTTSETVVFGGGGHKARVFEHPKVDRKIRVTYDPKTGNVVSALVLNPDESPVESLDIAPASIYQKAQSLMKEAESFMKEAGA